MIRCCSSLLTLLIDAKLPLLLSLSLPDVSAFSIPKLTIVKPSVIGSIGSTQRIHRQFNGVDTSPCDDRKYTLTRCDDTIDDPAAVISTPHQHRNRSFIRTIRSHKLAGFVGQTDEDIGDDVVISFADSSARLERKISSNSNLIVITGETASGKSLFIVRALEIISGKIASSQKLTSYIQQPPDSGTRDTSTTNVHDTFVEVETVLVNPHLSAIEQILKHRDDGKSDCQLVLPPVKNDQTREERFLFRRTLQLIPTKSQDTQRRRLKSICSINGKVVPLKDFMMFTTPLFAVVDATTAINAILSKSMANGNDSSDVRRTSILDSAISKRNLWKMYQAQKHYKSCRLVRIKYEKQMQYQQTSFRLSDTNGDDQARDLISHYIDELNSYAIRTTKFCQSLAILEGNDDPISSMPIVRIGNCLSRTKWNDNANKSALSSQTNVKDTRSTTPYVSSMFELLLEFQNELKTLQNQYQMATQISNSISSLASSNSARSAIERARKLLKIITDENQDISTGDSLSPLQKSSERLYAVLNQVDQSLHACGSLMQNDSEFGLLKILSSVLGQYSHVSTENISEMINEWKLLSRKHDVSPYVLPQCHDAFISERDGTNQIQNTLLPRARSEETIAYQQYWDTYQLVTNEREQVASELSKAMTETYLPRLGFAASTMFSIDIHRTNNTVDEYLSSISPLFLADKTDFLLSQVSINDNELNRNNTGNLVHEVSSSGERARILFAIECALPGSIGIACRPSPLNIDSWEIVDMAKRTENISKKMNSIGQLERWYNYTSLSPIVTIYDEIDAHIGGRAVKAMAQLLVQQSLNAHQQVMAITHNPTVAAAASTHIIISKEHPYGASEKVHYCQPLVLSKDHPNKRPEITNMNNTERDSAQVDIFEKKQLQQIISVHVIRGNPFNERRIQELVRMVCGSNDDDNIQNPLNTRGQTIKAMTFVKSLIRSFNK